MFNNATADRLPIPARANVSGINRDAIERAKKMLAEQCIRNAATAVNPAEREHFANVARLAGAVVTVSIPSSDALHTIDHSTSSAACGKVAQVVS
jgi:hypothetical protein